MSSLLNTSRPPVFCPGCAHERVTAALDKTFQAMGLAGHQVALVSDIGCSGLFDTFFNTHALHGLHGRALTYASGLKMASPELTVIVTMGDGGLGIGGAHLLSACRRNLDLTLLILNNFNYGMTGGQFSATTPPAAQVGSGFLNQLEKPIDACQVAAGAGAGFVARASAYQKDLSQIIAQAIGYQGFAVVDMWGICPGRYTKRNPLTPAAIERQLAALPTIAGPVMENQRREYGRHYRELAARQKATQLSLPIEASIKPPETGRCEVVILGAAGQRIVTAGEILGIAGISAGLHATQKNDYPITVLRGHSISELVLSANPIGYTGIDRPEVVVALAGEAVARRRHMLARLTENSLVLRANEVDLPPSAAQVVSLDFKAMKIKSADRALACLGILAKMGRVINLQMLKAALSFRFKGSVLESSLSLVDRVQLSGPGPG
jgi:2-oxoglutarate ferredoxin oxidoreductase subunit beta